jgi:hypothetical protein
MKESLLQLPQQQTRFEKDHLLHLLPQQAQYDKLEEVCNRRREIKQGKEEKRLKIHHWFVFHHRSSWIPSDPTYNDL